MVYFQKFPSLFFDQPKIERKFNFIKLLLIYNGFFTGARCLACCAKKGYVLFPQEFQQRRDDLITVQARLSYMRLNSLSYIDFAIEACS